MPDATRHREAVLLLAITTGLLTCTQSSYALGEDADKEPHRPAEVLQLFNGRDLAGLYTWMPETKYDDPHDVFSVRDGVLQISGEAYGYLCTKQAYRDYHLVLEFRWGQRTWEPRKTRSRDSGIMFHGFGGDGSAGTWMASHEYQIIEGGVGDLLVVPGTDADGQPHSMSLTCEVQEDRDGEPCWKRGGERRTFSRGRINWFGRDPDWEDVLGFRGAQDVESPHGQWTRCELTCDGDQVIARVNGQIVNEGYEASPAAGKILLQSEGAELFIRRWELHPLDQAPSNDAASVP